MLYLPFHCLLNCSNFLLIRVLITQSGTDLVQEKHLMQKTSTWRIRVQPRTPASPELLPHYSNWFCLFGMCALR